MPAVRKYFTEEERAAAAYEKTKRWRARMSPEQRADHYFKQNLKAKYGLTMEAYEALVEAQQGLCAVCGTEDKLFVDHDHGTGDNRGLLCQNCNFGLGHFRDNPDLLMSAAVYLLQQQNLLGGPPRETGNNEIGLDPKELS